MLTRKISVIIPTHNRLKLLEKLLESIKLAILPKNIDKIYIVENGSKVSEELVSLYERNLPVKYLHFEQGNKSMALNKTLEHIPNNHFVLFFDDDIEVTPNIFELYEEAINQMGEGHYYGGPTGVKYETPPNKELINYMPASNRGTSQDLRNVSISKQKLFLGFNWGIFKRDLQKINGFDKSYGPGSKSGARGQETDAQLRLYDIGLKPVYVPNALVYHWVPKHHLTKEWVMDRVEKSSMAGGKKGGNILKVVYWRMMTLRYSIFYRITGNVKFEYLQRRYKGFANGHKQIK